MFSKRPWYLRRRAACIAGRGRGGEDRASARKEDEVGRPDREMKTPEREMGGAEGGQKPALDFNSAAVSAVSSHELGCGPLSKGYSGAAGV